VERLKASKLPGQIVEHPVTIIDVVASMGLPLPGPSTGVLDEDTIVQAIAGHLRIPFKKIDPLKLDLDVVTKVVPRLFALKHLVIPIAAHDTVLDVVMHDPTDRQVLEDLKRVTTLDVRTSMGTKSDILKAIQEFFGFKSSIVAAETQLTRPSIDLGNLEQYTRLKSINEIQATDAHIKNAVEYLFHYAFDQRASDIHIEPKREKTLVRLRIDGVLHTVYELPKALHPAIISRIKTLSRLDIAERRRPQDGRLKVSHLDREAEIRVSTIPVAFGEKAVLRILDPTVLFQDLEDLGFSAHELILFRRFLQQTSGIILVTGPTGSGKSTTLYSSLGHLSGEDKNITTIEDPIEMVHEGFNQIAVQAGIGVTFSTVLRNILRQDPDVIMIGEIRDQETAEYAVQSALTGHLVFSTLHTNDAPSSLARLIQLGVKHFFIAESLVGVVAQRLLRKICPHCAESLSVDPIFIKSLGIDAGTDTAISLKQGKGCIKCRGTGYLGRTGVFEVMGVDASMKEFVSGTEKIDTATLRKKAMEAGMVSLRQNALEKLLKGVTTYQEVGRVLGQA